MFAARISLILKCGDCVIASIVIIKIVANLCYWEEFCRVSLPEPCPPSWVPERGQWPGQAHPGSPLRPHSPSSLETHEKDVTASDLTIVSLVCIFTLTGDVSCQFPGEDNHARLRHGGWEYHWPSLTPRLRPPLGSVSASGCGARACVECVLLLLWTLRAPGLRCLATPGLWNMKGGGLQ